MQFHTYLLAYVTMSFSMKHIIPISDLQRQAAAIVSEVNESNEPVIITQRGRASAVMMSADQYSRIEEDLALLDELELEQLVIEGRKQVKDENTLSLNQAKKRLGFKE
jgi:prevent-host-death family protein